MSLGAVLVVGTAVWSGSYDTGPATALRGALDLEAGTRGALGSEPTPGAVPPGQDAPPGSVDPTASWSVMLIGDTLLTRPVPAGTDPFTGQDPPLSSADITIANLETAITDRGERQVKEYTFRSRRELADRLRAAGVDIVSLANNHSLDFGQVGLDDTISALSDAGVESVGGGDNLAAAVEPIHRTVAGVRVAIFGVSQVIPDPKWVATPDRFGVASAGKNVIDDATLQLLAAVQQARATDDVVIVMMHWGKEKQTCPTEVQTRTAALLRKAGTTAVVGAHPHVLQPIVRDGDGVVAYSIGNFIWDPRGGLSADTGIIELNFTGTSFTGVQFHPHVLDAQGWGRAVRSGPAHDRILAEVHRRCPGADGTTW